jgi:hypothetical protein
MSALWVTRSIKYRNGFKRSPFRVTDQDSIRGTAFDDITTTRQREVQGARANIIIVQLTATTLLASISSGLVNVCIHRMAQDLQITPALYFW